MCSPSEFTFMKGSCFLDLSHAASRSSCAVQIFMNVFKYFKLGFFGELCLKFLVTLHLLVCLLNCVARGGVVLMDYHFVIIVCTDIL